MNAREESRGLAILGSTGSIGTQALEVVDAHPDRLRCTLRRGVVEGVLAHRAHETHDGKAAPGDIRATISRSATSNPPATCTERIHGDGGVASQRLATSVSCIRTRVAGRAPVIER